MAELPAPKGDQERTVGVSTYITRRIIRKGTASYVKCIIYERHRFVATKLQQQQKPFDHQIPPTPSSASKARRGFLLSVISLAWSSRPLEDTPRRLRNSLILSKFLLRILQNCLQQEL